MVKKGKGYQSKYLYPVKAMSKVFRGIFLRLIQDEQELGSQVDKSLLRKLYQNEWVVYAKQPFYSEERLGDIKHSILDNTKCFKLLGVVPKTLIEDGLNVLISESSLGVSL